MINKDGFDFFLIHHSMLDVGRSMFIKHHLLPFILQPWGGGGAISSALPPGGSRTAMGSITSLQKYPVLPGAQGRFFFAGRVEAWYRL